MHQELAQQFNVEINLEHLEAGPRGLDLLGTGC
jgi:hypothetical protein